MPTPREAILTALHARLSALSATVLRGEVLPERLPTDGLLILRDDDAGEPEVTLSPLAYHFRHRVEIEVVVQGADRERVRAGDHAALASVLLRSATAHSFLVLVLTATTACAPATDHRFCWRLFILRLTRELARLSDVAVLIVSPFRWRDV
jgi:hypothetical protein